MASKFQQAKKLQLREANRAVPSRTGKVFDRLGLGASSPRNERRLAAKRRKKS